MALLTLVTSCGGAASSPDEPRGGDESPPVEVLGELSRLEGADGAREYAVLTVEPGGDGAEACRVARRLAELAWPRLPAR